VLHGTGREAEAQALRQAHGLRYPD